MALWGQLTTSSPTPTASIPSCTPFELPSGGALVFNDTYTSTLTAKLTFQQPCDNRLNPSDSDPGASGNSTVVGLRDPFYASTSPQIFAIATATVIAYLLVIIIFITPRTFFVGGLGGAASTGFLGRSVNTSVIGVGRRPWLQKIATVTVAVSLTIATADTFRVAQEQYDMGYTDAGLLVDNVVGSLEIRIVRLISDTFLWLAQVQTLIRLFPRHKEKVTIKWLGFALVSLDTIFSILDDFVNQSPTTRPRSFQDAIPALNYLFELAISLIYASCVIYYSLSKRRFAFWHKRMRNICLVALLSLVAVLIPVVFFVLDVSKPDVAGWGDYIRWVGAAAASVVVWEWVERIEALERDERKDGILGREIFDGDEMLDGPAVQEADFPGRRQYWNRHGFPTEDPGQAGGSTGGIQVRALRARIPFGSRLRGGDVRNETDDNQDRSETIVAPDSTGQLAMAALAASPISRSDATSAGSTVYAIRYHTTTTPTIQEPSDIVTSTPQAADTNPFQALSKPSSLTTAAQTSVEFSEKEASALAQQDPRILQRNEMSKSRSLPVWRTVLNPFKRRRASPPAEVAAQIAESDARRSPVERTVALRDYLSSAGRSRTGPNDMRTSPDIDAMSITVIPAQRRGHSTWSPDQNRDLETDLDDEEQEQHNADQHEQVSHSFTQPSTAIPSSHSQDDHELPVLIIPAPRRGQRTWSPEDTYQGVVPNSRISSPLPNPDPSSNGTLSQPTVTSTRRTLTFSHDQARSQPQWSAYARSSSTNIREQGRLPASRVTTPIADTAPALEAGVVRHARSFVSDSEDQNEPDLPAHTAPTESVSSMTFDEVSGYQRP